MVGEVGGVPARVSDLEQLDVLVALGHVVGELELLLLPGTGAVDQLAKQALVGVGQRERAPGDIRDLLDMVDDLRIGQVGRRLAGPGDIVDVVVGVALGVVVDGERTSAGRIGEIAQEFVGQLLDLRAS